MIQISLESCQRIFTPITSSTTKERTTQRLTLMTLPMVKFPWAMDTTIILAIFQRIFSCCGEGHFLDGSAVYKMICLSEVLKMPAFI